MEEGATAIFYRGCIFQVPEFSDENGNPVEKDATYRLMQEGVLIERMRRGFDGEEMDYASIAQKQLGRYLEEKGEKGSEQRR